MVQSGPLMASVGGDQVQNRGFYINNEVSQGLSVTMTSSNQEHKINCNTSIYKSTADPPPTPSTKTNGSSSNSFAAFDDISVLLCRLPPSLSLPPRRSSQSLSPPLISFCSDTPDFLDKHLPFISKLGYFLVTDHSIPLQLAQAANDVSFSLFDLPFDIKLRQFPSNNWPLGYDHDNDEKIDESFCFSSSCFSDFQSTLALSSLHGFALQLEKIGLKIMETMSSALGFLNCPPLHPLMWVSDNTVSSNEQTSPSRSYPYVIALQYQIRCQKYSLLTDSGWVSVLPDADSVLVTVGDIAQVWSNGKLKKVRGRPIGVSENNNSRCITMSLLLTLPNNNDILVSPLLPITTEHGSNKNNIDLAIKDEKLFNAFYFEDYAWRVYHERYIFKDPLVRYKVNGVREGLEKAYQTAEMFL